MIPYITIKNKDIFSLFPSILSMKERDMIYIFLIMSIWVSLRVSRLIPQILKINDYVNIR